MPLHRLYNVSTGSGNPSYLTGLLPGGAGVQTAGTSTNPMVSAPRLEESTIEVLDVTGPSLIGLSTAAQAATPAIAGKLLVMDPIQGAFGSRWKLNSVKSQAIPRGQYGIVQAAGLASDAGVAVSTSSGNEGPGVKAVVMYDGPIQAFCTSTVNTAAISAGMPLGSDGAGNLTALNQPVTNAGTVLATAAGNLATAISIPALLNVYVGGY